MQDLASNDCPFHVVTRRDRIATEERRRFRRAVTALLGTTSKKTKVGTPITHKRKNP